ncbi:Putative IQ domain-containing protein IQM [Septoria linicola]|uniref:IQ domain-containing protein IQM n=1 Tax=Septoria linicola TaxID=215465 RepID=A0A9Q9AZB6_9PEZI|nr:putative IQ domain-containing protein IQM [Septoria linicola]USW54793.1 Putative IQ domain-containing protein IQM [Septoria linicola]
MKPTTPTKKKLDPLALPSPEKLRQIEQRQNEKAQEIRARRMQKAAVGDDERTSAAELIQRNFRGHQARRAMKGYALDPSTRWLEALKDANYTRITSPQSNAERFTESQTTLERVKKRWVQAGAAARRAGSDNTSDEEDGHASQAETREQKRKQKQEREKYAKMMGLEYFLEMVDQKHRYGSNLRRYHKEWMTRDTKENFFYWLDYGEGKNVDIPDRPRERLDREQVRYLSREGRKKYLVNIDKQGRFVWNKDGKPITTSPDWKDSIDGIVHSSNATPTWREVTTGEKPEPRRADSSDDSSSIASTLSTGSQEDSSKYANEEFHNARGLNKLHHVSVDALMNHLLRKTTKKNTWIFVADTSFRLYVGIKQSGAFQHSSFLKGARVAAAGLVKIKRGQIRKLSPLSGHYAPPVRNFREFLKNLKAEGADLSRLNVSRSYAVILGLEGYLTVKERAKNVKQGAKDVFDPEEKKKRLEAEKDKSQSAQREREVLAREQREQRSRSMSHRFVKRMGLRKDDGDGELIPVLPNGPVDADGRPVVPKSNTIASGSPAQDASTRSKMKEKLTRG